MKQLLIWIGVGMFLLLAISYFDKVSSVFEKIVSPVLKGKNSGINIEYPKLNQKVVTPFLIQGEALGLWYFEGSFPVLLENQDGDVLASGVATAKGNWMTNGYVPFESKFSYDGGATGPAKFVFQRDNPSGLSEYDKSFELPIIINQTDYK